MSKVLDGVNPAEATTATEAPSFESFAEFQSTWSPDEKREWDASGKEPEPKPATPQAEPAKKTLPAVAESQPAITGEEDQDHEPEYTGSPEQIKAQRSAFLKIRREKTEARTEARLLREQLAELKKVAPAATSQTPKEGPKTAPQGERPKRPRVSDPKYANDSAGELYDADMDKYEEASEAYRTTTAEANRAASETQATQRSRQELWASEVTNGKAAHADFEAVAFSPNVFLSLPMIGALTGMKGGAELLYQLGSNPELAKELTDLTDIPGNFANYDELVEAAKKDPELRVELRAAEKLVDREIKRLQSGLSRKTTDLKPITVSGAPAPAARVDASGSGPAKDALAEANRMYEETGEHKYLTLINELEDKREAELRKRKR